MIQIAQMPDMCRLWGKSFILYRSWMAIVCEMSESHRYDTRNEHR